ncbi:ash family protein [Serratia proteamaculans]|nr:ash family protein [Serratia proteamaculans]
MVAQAEASQEAPVSLVSGNANSVWATTMGLASHGGSGTPHQGERPHGKYFHLTTRHKHPRPLSPTVQSARS